MEKIVDKIRALPLPAMGLAFLAGLLLGWLAIGWWLWPVSWTNADPWDLRSDHQERYLTLVAKHYARTGDGDQAQAALIGWDDEALANLLAAMQDRAPDSEARQQLAELASVLELPRGEAVAAPEPRPSSAVPPLKSRLLTVCATAGLALVVVVLIIFAASTRPELSLIKPRWESIAKRLRQARRTRSVEAPDLTPGHFVSVYAQGRDDYEDYFPIEAPDGQFLGSCGLRTAHVLGREMPRRVTALEMVLFDSPGHITETRMLMSRYAHENAMLREELMTRGELILAEPGAQIQVETDHLKMSATITDLGYADQRPAEGVFQRVAIELAVRVKHLPQGKSEDDV